MEYKDTETSVVCPQIQIFLIVNNINMSVLLSQQNQNIGIFGLGKTGIAVYESVKDIAKVICYDQLDSNQEMFATIYGTKDLADLSDLRWKSLDKILLSPGVSLSHEIIDIAHSHNIPITSDIDLLFEESKTANYIAITGTNGKSTSTALTGHILQCYNFDYPVGGNIGIPALSMPLHKTGYILELSSFQLDLLKSFKAKIALLLNITPDHLDRHQTMDLYIAAKKKIFDRMDKDSFAIINVDNVLTKNVFLDLERENRINLVPISTCTILDKGVSILKNIVYDNVFEKRIINLPANKYLQGTHNQENIAGVYAICQVMGLMSEQIITAINKFQGLPHRMQYIGEIKGINFYNDSKATNSEAASQSIRALDNIYWLAGGITKEGGIKGLEPWFYKISKAYLFGQDKECLVETLNNKVDFQIYRDLEQAFNAAFKDATKDKRNCKHILLAPACASYDQFENFIQRGNIFIKLCQTKIADYESI